MVLTSFTTIETNNLNIIGGNYSSGKYEIRYYWRGSTSWET
jgi:hypothetical protein